MLDINENVEDDCIECDEAKKIAKIHWTNVYTNAAIERLGWYENSPIPSIDLINECSLPKDALIFNAGAGATTLVDELLRHGYINIIANDISEPALKNLYQRINEKDRKKVRFIVDDLTSPTELSLLRNIDIWHDRAVLHFFTREKQVKNYFDLLKKVVRKQGYVIIAEFNLDGAKRCSGLDVVNYSADMIQDHLGDDFNLMKSFDYIYTMPSGDERPYVYTLFQRQ